MSGRISTMLVALKPLIVVLVLGFLGTFLGRKVLCPDVIPASRFNAYAYTALGITAAAYLGQNFLVYTAIAALVVWVHLKKVHPAALLAAALFCTPAFNYEVGGIGGINQLVVYKVQYVFIYLACWRWRASLPKKSAHLKFGASPVDWLLLAWLAHQALTTLNDATATVALKYVMFEGGATFALYYVFSRSIRSQADLKEVVGVLVLQCIVMGLVACFESTRQWLLYSPLEAALGIVSGGGEYSMRAGMLRARASAYHPIVLGAVLGVGLLLAMGVTTQAKRSAYWLGMVGCLVLGMVVTFSRGPWVATMGAYVLWLLLSPNRGANFSKLLMFGVVAMVALSLTPQGGKIIDLLPWVGDADSATIDYRNQLLETSWTVFWENPLMGSPYYMYEPIMQSLVQGEGIIDVVNTYLAVAMSFGLLGLLLFVGPYAATLALLWRGARTDSNPIGRSLLAALACLLVTLATVSNIGSLPLLCWVIVGTSVASAKIHLAKV